MPQATKAILSAKAQYIEETQYIETPDYTYSGPTGPQFRATKATSQGHQGHPKQDLQGQIQ